MKCCFVVNIFFIFVSRQNNTINDKKNQEVYEINGLYPNPDVWYYASNGFDFKGWNNNMELQWEIVKNLIIT